MSSMSYNTDIVKLNKLIRLPSSPQNACWQTYEKGAGLSEIGPTDWELIAILEYDKDNMQELRSQMSEQTHPTDLYVNHDFVKDWFPEPVKQRLVQDNAYLEYLKFIGPRYNPDLFTQSPLSDGFIVIIDNLLFLFVHTM